jgi:hypothetical protein
MKDGAVYGLSPEPSSTIAGQFFCRLYLTMTARFSTLTARYRSRITGLGKIVHPGLPQIAVQANAILLIYCI